MTSFIGTRHKICFYFIFLFPVFVDTVTEGLIITVSVMLSRVNLLPNRMGG